jgi:thioesterase domain-containing protein
MKHSGDLMKAFMPRRFRGDVLLFVATHDDVPPRTESWRPYVSGRIDVYPIDCQHTAMMDPVPAAKIGKRLAAEFDKR